ncbi:hypothetical protein GCM10010195_36220 [Kitasatospora griseola]|nr:hypothetical protein GCM10010195_36220 [Kitasatospora griseola]
MAGLLADGVFGVGARPSRPRTASGTRWEPTTPRSQWRGPLRTPVTSTVHRLPEHHGASTVEPSRAQRQDRTPPEVSQITPPREVTAGQAIQKNTQVIRFSSSVVP